MAGILSGIGSLVNPSAAEPEIPASGTIADDEDFVDLTIDNTANVDPVAVAFTLSGDDPTEFALDQAVLHVAAGDTETLRISRDGAEGNSAGSCAIVVVYSSGGADGSIPVTKAEKAISTLAGLAESLNATHYWSFPVASPLNDQVGTAHFVSTQTRKGDSPIPGCDGYVECDLADFDADVAADTDIGRDVDRTWVFVCRWSTTPLDYAAACVFSNVYSAAEQALRLIWWPNPLALYRPDGTLGFNLTGIDRTDNTWFGEAILLVFRWDATTQKMKGWWESSSTIAQQTAETTAYGSVPGVLNTDISLGGNIPGSYNLDSSSEFHHISVYDGKFTDTEVDQFRTLLTFI